MKSVRFFVLLGLLTSMLLSGVAIAEVKVWEEQMTLPTYEVQPGDPNPRFYEGRTYQGAQGPVYPYPMLDGLSDEKADKDWTALYLENDYLRICVLPEIGGRLFEALDKTNNHDFFYRQHVIKPDLIGMLGAWISGGVEWCVFHHHRDTTYMPVDYELIENEDGSATIWFGETERRHRMKWLIGLTLRPGCSRLDVTVKMMNPTAYTNSILYWANVAVHSTDDYQIIFPPSVQWATFHGKHEFSQWPISHQEFHGYDYSAGVDVSMWKSHPKASSFFAWDSQHDYFAGYDHNLKAGVAHVADHHVVPGMKLWTWGTKSTWDRTKLTDDDGPYAEIMVGAYSDNQPDYSWIRPHEVKVFNQSWYPIRELGGMLSATKEAALNLTVAEGTAKIALNTTSKHAKAKAILTTGDKQLWEQVIAIDPATPFATEVKLPEGTEETSLNLSLQDAEGVELVSYQPRTYPEVDMPEPVEAPPAPEEIETVEELYLTGLRLQQFYNPSVEPYPYYEEALKRDPGDTRVNIVLAIDDCKRGKFAEAEAKLRIALKRTTKNYTRPKEGDAHYYLGVALVAQEKYDEAYDAYNRAAWNYAWHTASMYALAELDCRKGEWETALEHIDNALDTNARDNRALCLKSAILRQLGKVRGARLQSRKALNFDPLDFHAAEEQYRAHRLARQSRPAEKVRSALITRMRGNEQAYLELASTYMASGFYQEASEILSRLTNDKDAPGSEFPMLYYYLGYCHEQLGDAAAALDTYKLASEKSPVYCFPYRLESIIILKSAMAMNPKDGRAPYYLGNLLYDRQPEAALASWETARATDPKQATLQRNLGFAYAKRDEIKEAIASYEASVQADSKDPRVFYELELINEKAGTDPQTRLALLNQNPDTVLKRDDLVSRKIMLEVQVGQYDEAIETLTTRKFDTWEGGGGIHSVYVNAFTLRGYQALKAKENQKALDDFIAALDYPANLGVDRPLNDPKATRTYVLIARTQQLLGDAAKAKEALEKAVAIDVGGSEFRFAKGYALRELGKTEEAKVLFDALIADGEKQLKDGAEVDFFAAFGEKQSHDNQMAEAHYLLALGELGNGDTATAKDNLNKALELNPNHLWAKVQLEDIQ